MKRLFIYLLPFLLLLGSNSLAQESYFYKDREHTKQEFFEDLSFVFGLSLIAYPLTQWDTVKNEGSLEVYRKNFGRIVFDRDEPFWNYMVHPYTGSQMFLYYRARSYSYSDSLALTFVSSTVFEFFIEVYTEPASVQDLYQTPVLGAVMGYGFEKLSMELLNNGGSVSIFFGHLINPMTLFSSIFEGRGIKASAMFAPSFDKKSIGYFIHASF
ncbi:hypothetical protein BALOs_2289 [Halobacteriovorax sp. BALOs_7]|uniref:DUF3943 domain-containing protein n=1 Tax=Halobacteriovorax sp. BALOs_7 TaxID=2109558 RepID=UPI000EA2EE6B|nr:DUF3943 domain-containing protein [Halobacteriovorax sp. BALOs_7]AYF45287.1 hypothetical protein BALOs_2289 [Halobacteriovorax sp. BALOs_7]